MCLLLLSLILIYQESDIEKFSAYECGFQPFEDARTKFDVKYYLVAILFILFDLELMFLVP
jgi:NADH-quinone oxidoreductase subunit A